jgi:hypothetical protein
MVIAMSEALIGPSSTFIVDIVREAGNWETRTKERIVLDIETDIFNPSAADGVYIRRPGWNITRRSSHRTIETPLSWGIVATTRLLPRRLTLDTFVLRQGV